MHGTWMVGKPARGAVTLLLLAWILVPVGIAWPQTQPAAGDGDLQARLEAELAVALTGFIIILPPPPPPPTDPPVLPPPEIGGQPPPPLDPPIDPPVDPPVDPPLPPVDPPTEPPVNPSETPEPATLVSGLIGLGMLAAWKRRKRRKENVEEPAS